MDPTRTDAQRLAELLASGTPNATATYELPATLGRGRVTLVAAEPGLLLALRRLWLQEERMLRPGGGGDPAGADVLLLSFQLRQRAAGAPWHLAAVLLTSEDVGITVRLPARTELFTVNLAVAKHLVASWLRPATAWLDALLAARAPVVYDALGTPELLRVLLELAQPRPAHAWDGFFYVLKAQEVVYYLFRELSQRATTTGYSLRPADVEALFQVREQVLAALATPPSLPQLARSVGLNETKFNGLFQQIFGATLYQYYQAARMSEAKRQLAEFSVSEVGYQLGFTNLSHFTRLFAKHHGLNPKQYKLQVSGGKQTEWNGLVTTCFGLFYPKRSG